MFVTAQSYDADLMLAGGAESMSNVDYVVPGSTRWKGRLPNWFKKFQKVYGVESGSLPNLERFLAPWNERLA